MGGPAVLCVDDDVFVREVTQAALERNGYAVVLASNGAEAIAALESTGNPISLVLLDWTMPGISGADLVARLKQIRPNVKILLTSGYSHVAALPLFANLQVDGFVPKPYVPKQIVEIVSRAIFSACRRPRSRSALRSGLSATHGA